jgi:hypothetical protein
MQRGRTVSPADCGERGSRASDVRQRRVAPAGKELRNGSNKSEREPTRARSTNCGRGHLAKLKEALTLHFLDNALHFLETDHIAVGFVL